MVRGLRGDAGRVPARIDSAAPAAPAREHREGEGDGAEVVRPQGPGRRSRRCSTSRARTTSLHHHRRSKRPRWRQCSATSWPEWCRSRGVRPLHRLHRRGRKDGSRTLRSRSFSRDTDRAAVSSSRRGRPHLRSLAPPPGTSLERNYRSVLAAQRMKEASERLDSAASSSWPEGATRRFPRSTPTARSSRPSWRRRAQRHRAGRGDRGTRSCAALGGLRRTVRAYVDLSPRRRESLFLDLEPRFLAVTATPPTACST